MEEQEAWKGDMTVLAGNKKPFIISRIQPYTFRQNTRNSFKLCLHDRDATHKDIRESGPC
jgi:hypothetical protein